MSRDPPESDFRGSYRSALAGGGPERWADDQGWRPYP